MSHPPQLSVVLPCYNEARGIENILDRFAEVAEGREFELILVDNGSSDNTPEVLRALLPWYPFARSVRVEVNQGYGHGIYTGLQAARGEVLAWSHADLQTDPADVFRALNTYRAAAQPTRTLVKGSRHGRRFSERVISFGMGMLASLIFRTPFWEINAQPKLFHRSLLDHATNPPIDFNLDVYMLVQAKRNGWKIESINVQFPPRQYGHSNWARTWKSKIRTISRSIKYMLRLAVVGDAKATPAITISTQPSTQRKAA